DDRAERAHVLEARAEVADLAGSRARLLRPLDRDLELAALDRLPDVVARSEPDRLDRGLDRRVAREEDHLRRHWTLVRRSQDVEAVAVLEVEVGDDDVVGPARELAARGLRALGAVDLERAVLEEGRDRLELVRVVVDDERALGRGSDLGLDRRRRRLGHWR